MQTLSLAQRLRRNLYMKGHLEGLGELTGRVVHADELTSLELVSAMQVRAKELAHEPPTAYDIPFSDRKSERFRNYLQHLTHSNPAPIYVWTEHTTDCGALLVPSLDAIRFDAEHTILREGILAFTTSTLDESLLLDIACDPTDEPRIKLEALGANWAKVIY